jgi:gas vesicle protein
MMKFLVGALVGACCGLLLAPQSGAQTRSQIRDKANKMGHDIEDFAQSKGRHLSNKMQGYKHKMHKMAESLRGRAEAEMTGAGMEI